ncbi:MAG TPA: serine protease, partial [Mesorhizobium sp.]
MTSKILSRARAATIALLLLGGSAAAPAYAASTTGHGPESVADLAQGLLGAVVNISTSQTVKGTEGPGAVPMPQLPEGSPFQDFFDDFFKNREGDKG